MRQSVPARECWFCRHRTDLLVGLRSV
jgi:hypothetical protein